mgnify:CR=1 FL=1
MEAPSDTKSSRFVSVKFDAVGRSRTFLLPDIDFDPQLEPGDPVVVQTGARKSYGAIVRSVPESAERKAPAAGGMMGSQICMASSSAVSSDSAAAW